MRKKDKVKISHSINQRRAAYTKKRERINRKFKGKDAQLRTFNKLVKYSRTYKVPRIFSLRDSSVKSIKFVNKLKKDNSNSRIYLNMKEVDSISNGAIALLTSVVNDFTAKGRKVIGSMPKKSEPRKTLELSGFFNYMNGPVTHNPALNPNTIIEQGNKCVEPQITAKIVKAAMKTISGRESRNQKLQGLFIELMANSINHGFPHGSRKKWILSTNHYTSKRKVGFSFIDNGVGILETLNQKIPRRVETFFKGKHDLLQSAFKGDIGSRTSLPFRGKGLPFIKRKFDEGVIDNLFVLTNNVILDYGNSKHIELPISYSGTFYYFELNKK